MDTNTCTGACSCQHIADERGSVSRRGVLAGSAAAAAAVALAACSSSDEASSVSTPSPEAASADPTAEESPSAASGASGEVLVGVDEFPVGGGAIVQASVGPVVVTHPDDDVYLAFTAVCTHASCTVAEVLENTITCNCHGSTYDGSTGNVLGGPAPTGLAEIEIEVSDGEITLA